MVVLSASICTRSGKALVSRQFVEMNRLRIEGLLAAFPKLLSQKQHTFVETDSVRYVYQPLEGGIYLLLITTKTSNIVEDLGTLRLLAKVVPDVCKGLAESHINEHAFELIFAFDEVLTSGGYKDEVTLSSIKANLLMDSHEEKMANMLKQSKEDAARDEMKRQAKQIRDTKIAQMGQKFGMENTMGGIGSHSSGSGMVGFGGGGMDSMGSGSMSGFGSSSGFESNGFGGAAATSNGDYSNSYSAYQSKPDPTPSAPRVMAKGMKLGAGGGLGSSKKTSLMEAMAAEDNLMGSMNMMSSSGLSSSTTTNTTNPTSNMPATPTVLVVEEKLIVQMNREGTLENVDVKGTLSLTANKDEGSMVSVAVNKATLGAVANKFSFATHPKVSKPNYESDGVLQLKDTRKGFPLNRPVGILRWNYNGADAAPITINCWPENEGSGRINVSIEFELQRPEMSLHDVNILIPLGTSDQPSIDSIDGHYKHNAREGVLCWHHDLIDSNNSSGSLDFSISGSNEDVFFPVTVQFTSENLMCPIEISAVSSLANGAPVGYSQSRLVIPESYTCS